MTQVDFDYEGTTIRIHSSLDEKFEDIIKKFAVKIRKKKEDFYFIYGGKLLNENLTFNEQANSMDKKRKIMDVIVENKLLEDNNQDEKFLKKSKYIICPKCKESARILVDNYIIELYDCKNGHKINNISINEFEKTQNIDEAKIICDNCNKVNKSTSYKNTFFICLECKKKLCQLCKSVHDKNHNIIDYDDKSFICDLHSETYFSYCLDCKKDVCMICEKEHNAHKTVTYGSIFPNVDKIKEETNNFKIKKEGLKNEIKDIINKLNDIIYTLDNYYKIFEDVVNSYGNKKRNYSLLQNINDMIQFNNKIILDINAIINEKNYINKINNIYNIYDKMNILNKANQIYEELKNEFNKNINLIEKNEIINYFIKNDLNKTDIIKSLNAKIKEIEEKKNKQKIEEIYNELNFHNLDFNKNEIMNIIKVLYFDKVIVQDWIDKKVTEELYTRLSKLNDVDIRNIKEGVIKKKIKELKFNFEEIKKVYQKKNPPPILYNEEEVNLLFRELDDDYGIAGFLNEEKAKAKIRELKCNKDDLIDWIENNLLNNDITF